MCLKATPSRKVPQTPAFATSKWGLNGEERAALFRVRTGLECSDSNRRELTWDSSLNCGIAREREKTNWRKALTEHTAARSQNKGRTEQFQRRARQLWAGPSSAGGRRQGGGERGNLSHLKTHYWTLHCTPERRNPVPHTRTLMKASLTRKPWHRDKVKCPNIWIIGVQEEEDNKKGHEKILKEIIAENFPKMGKEIVTQVQETQRVPNRINPRQNTQDTY